MRVGALSSIVVYRLPRDMRWSYGTDVAGTTVGQLSPQPDL